ncbi:MAG: PAS domain S-box protein [Armatimonadota bacterium]|nr:PAS domain S-box protein [Armatimonadota bacterium]
MRTLVSDLRCSEERYRRTVDSLRQVVFRLDARGRWQFLNAAWTDLTGYAVADSLGTCFLDYVHPEDRQRHAELFQARGRGDGYVTQEVRYLTRAGSVRWVEAWGQLVCGDGGGVVGVFGTLTDITDRKRAEEERALLISAVEQAAEAILVADREGTVVYVNPAFEQFTGYRAGEVVGGRAVVLDQGDEHQALFHEIHEAVVAGNSWRGEVATRRKDGSILVQDLSVAPVRNSQGAMTHFVVMGQDITARQQMEQQLRRAQKMDAIGRLAGGVAHDFNNILTVITGRCELLLRRLDSADPFRRDVGLILQSAQRARGLTRQLLAFSRMQKLQPRVLDLNEVVRGVERLLRQLIGEDVELVTHLASDLGRVYADPNQLEQVLMNLAVNAREAMPHGGRITVETGNVEFQGAGSSLGRSVMLAVHDTGIGMDAETRARIFEPFFTTKGERGTGLGLATVYGIVKQSGGEIEVESEPGRGATFRVYLPRTEAPLGEEEAARAGPVGGGTERILLVEDEAEVRRLAADILRTHGYTVVQAANGEEGLAVALSPDARFDLVITDVILPGLSGAELARQLTGERPDVKVLYMSGYTDEEITPQGVAVEAVALLLKPFTAEELLRAVRGVLDGQVPASKAGRLTPGAAAADSAGEKPGRV